MGKEKKIDYQQFLTLARKMLAEQYGEENDNKVFQEILEEASEPAPIRRIDPQSSIDLTNVKSDKLMENISKTGNVIVGKFVLKIIRGKSEPEALSFFLYEQGKDQIHRRIQETDLRFRDALLLLSRPISLAGLVALVRHLQIISKMSIFL